MLTYLFYQKLRESVCFIILTVKVIYKKYAFKYFGKLTQDHTSGGISFQWVLFKKRLQLMYFSVNFGEF